MSEYYAPEEGRQYTEEDYIKMTSNVADWSRLSKKSFHERLALAKSLGPNWACILSGLGDQ